MLPFKTLALMLLCAAPLAAGDALAQSFPNRPIHLVVGNPPGGATDVIARTIGTAHGVPALKAALDLLGYTGGQPRPPLRVAPATVIETLRSQLAALEALPLVH